MKPQGGFMDFIEDDIKRILTAHEESLLKNEIRSDAAAVADLLDDTYADISESGARHNLQPDGVLEKLDGVLYIMDDSIHIIDLSDDCKLFTYDAAKVKKNTRNKASCSSIWRNTAGKWKLVFHQRTSVS
jgi:hypothetical protein